ncbi:hypothetical protein Pcinc_002087 [Petrolisthes cinctipes]|uniref:Uncharacterized protein n=1 Tax=Petrolisthes cinctipes TaxID=88211 RepID=A0AAE1GLQ8_PETCI|nr:hypothetical protein Pcinc_002087 [Petrolisthes cinctipes]
MDSGLLSLKWNNHGTTFFHVLSTIRRKESYCDVTLACEGKFYPVHKLVLSTCSEYFEEIFNRTQCKHPVIVLKDVKHEELEALLNYMYLGEVNVLQAELAGLIKAAECLKIKGLAVPDEAPSSRSGGKEKRSASLRDHSPPQPKKVRHDESHNLESSRESRESSRANAASSRTSEEGYAGASFTQSGPSQDGSREKRGDTRELPTEGERSRGEKHKDAPPSSSPSQSLEVLVHDESIVKTEVLEEPKEEEESNEDMLNSDNSVAYNPLTPSMQGDGVSEGPPQGFDPQVLTSQPQTMEELVAQAMPGTSGLQGDSLVGWGGGQGGGGAGGDLSRFSLDAFQLEDSQSGSQSSSQQQQMGPGSGLLPAPPAPFLRFPCCVCGRTFGKKHHLKDHMYTHTGERPYQCPVCGSAFTQKSTMRRHVRNAHPHIFDLNANKDQGTGQGGGGGGGGGSSRGRYIGSPMPVPVPVSVSMSPSSVGRYVPPPTLLQQPQQPLPRIVNINETDKWASRMKNRWECPHPSCDYVTHCESKLKMHFRRHTGEKPFVCPHCSFKSAQRGNLNVHIKKHHLSLVSEEYNALTIYCDKSQ